MRNLGLVLILGATLLLAGCAFATNGGSSSPSTSPEVSTQCQPGPGEIGSVYVMVETVAGDSFTGSAAIRAGGPIVESVTVKVTPSTEWYGPAQSLADLRPGMKWIQAVGPRQDDCSVMAVRIFSPGTPSPGSTPSATPND